MLILVQGALKLSAHVLARDPHQLAGQLMGRLLSFKEPDIQSMLEHACAIKSGIWLRPMRASLTPPGGPLITTMEGHNRQVMSVAVTPDGRRVISGDYNTIKVWDLET